MERQGMRVVLVVTDERLEEAAMTAWRAFCQTVSPPPFAYSDCVTTNTRDEPSCVGVPPRATANAEWVPPGGILPEYARLCLSEAFFTRSPDQQVVILLHEAVHIRLYRGRLIENYRIIRRQPRFGDPTPRFELDRQNLSEEWLTFVQEVGVDKFVSASNWPTELLGQYFMVRASYYLDGEAHYYDDSRSPSLAVYRVFYRLLRADLGWEVIRNPATREQLRALRERYAAELVTLTEDNLPWFQDLRRQLLAVTVDTDVPDLRTYDELFDRVRSDPPSTDRVVPWR